MERAPGIEGVTSEKGYLQPGSGRLKFLDGLRGIAALVVVIHHFCLVVPWADEPCGRINGLLQSFPFAGLINGPFSVFVFFVLSGFVLAESSSRGKDSLAIQIVARYLRLTVPMLISLIFAWALYKLFPHVREDFLRLNPSAWLQDKFYVSSLPGLVQPFKDGIYEVYLTGFSRLNVVVWTMHYEFIGSIGVYLIYKLVPLSGRNIALACTLVLGLLSPKYLGFSIGMIFREFWVQGRMAENPKAWIGFVLAVLVCSTPDVVFNPESIRHSLAGGMENHLFQLIDPIAAALLVYAVLTLHVLRRFLCRQIPQFLGRISFALYLFHVPLIGSVIAWLLTNLTYPFYLKNGIAFMAFLSASIGIAWLMTVAMDEPLMNALHTFKKWGRGRRNPVVTGPTALEK